MNVFSIFTEFCTTKQFSLLQPVCDVMHMLMDMLNSEKKVCELKSQMKSCSIVATVMEVPHLSTLRGEWRTKCNCHCHHFCLWCHCAWMTFMSFYFYKREQNWSGKNPQPQTLKLATIVLFAMICRSGRSNLTIKLFSWKRTSAN